MAARNGQTVDAGASTRIPQDAGRGTAAGQAIPRADGEEPLTGRYPIVAFSYDADASRLVMLLRDPADGKAVSQIPTEAALKQYKEAQKTERKEKRAAELEVLVGGRDGESGSRGTAGSSSPSGFAPAGSGSGRFMPSGPADSPGTTSVSAPSVASSPVATTRSTPAASGVERVNVVI